MRRLVRFALVSIAISAAPLSRAQAQTPADSSAIRQTALDYIEGWYEGNAERMERALHPELAKRIVNTDARGRSNLGEMGALTLINKVKAGLGKETPTGQRRTDVRILDVFGNTASVRIDASSWVDYLHVAKSNGRWVIVNVLWENRP